MKPCVFVFVLGTLLYGVSSMTHSMRIFYTASSQVPKFPEYVALIMVDGVQVNYYDSNTKRVVPKQDWMNKVTEENPQYWEEQTQIQLGTEQSYKANIEIVKQRLNQTGGIHIYQQMYGCEWDDETNRVTGYRQYGFDGEDFIVFDFKTQKWIAPRSEAVITKHKWDNNDAMIANDKNYFTQRCPDWLKKYVQYGKDTLMRTEVPSINLLQKTSMSPVTCHATGFFPDRAMLFWAKDGDEVHEGVEPGEILPNHDGTFQMSVELDMSTVKAEDWGKYSCVFQLSGVEDIFTKLDKAVIRTNEKSSTTLIIIAVLAALCLLVVAALGVFVYKKRNAKRPPSPLEKEPGVMEELNPTK